MKFIFSLIFVLLVIEYFMIYSWYLFGRILWILKFKKWIFLSIDILANIAVYGWDTIVSLENVIIWDIF